MKPGLTGGEVMSQRQQEDRRQLLAGRSYPFMDSNGERVREERRKQPDRRTNGIEEAEWLDMPEQSENIQVDYS